MTVMQVYILRYCGSAVLTQQIIPVIIPSFAVTATLDGGCIILLTPLNYSFRAGDVFTVSSVYEESDPACFVGSLDKAEEARLSLDNIYFNILCVDSV